MGGPWRFRGTAKLAGGCVLDAQGNSLGEFADLCQTTTIVATATEELAREIIDALA